MSIRQIEKPCWEAFCDKCGRAVSSGDYDSIHFASREEAAEYAESYDYIERGEQLFCIDCDPGETTGVRPEDVLIEDAFGNLRAVSLRLLAPGWYEVRVLDTERGPLWKVTLEGPAARHRRREKGT